MAEWFTRVKKNKPEDGRLILVEWSYIGDGDVNYSSGFYSLIDSDVRLCGGDFTIDWSWVTRWAYYPYPED